MPKVNNNRQSRNSNSSNNRPKPMVPKSGYTQTRRRYGSGGKACK